MEQVNYNWKSTEMAESMGINLFYYIFSPEKIFEFPHTHTHKDLPPCLRLDILFISQVVWDVD